MTVRMISYSTIALACAMMAAPVFAEPVYGPVVEFEGRHYQVVKHNGVSWSAADTNARSRTFPVGDGPQVYGHLATLTSKAEDEFVEWLRAAAYEDPYTVEVANTVDEPRLSSPEVWVGGSQLSCTPEEPGWEEPGCGWQWENGEGPISTEDVPLLSYSNWQLDEPNDCCDGVENGAEQHMAIGLGNVAGWNDEGALGNIGGYIIEFDTASNVELSECFSGSGCETTRGQTMLFPPVALGQDASIGIRTYEFTDDPDRCGKDPLTLFGGDNVSEDAPPLLIIPPYLCGSPKFLVVEVDTDGFEFQKGTILVNNEPREALPDNLYECLGPPGTLPGALVDPQQRDVVAWQSTDYRDMLENDFGGMNSMFAGSLGEFTDECGSSRGKIKSASYYVIGLHINFGAMAELEEGKHDMFVALTGYKLKMLRASVVESRRALKPIVYKVMLGLVDSAIKLHNRGRYQAALLAVRVFLVGAENVSYATTPGENYNGEHVMRGSNIKFTLEERVIPFAP